MQSKPLFLEPQALQKITRETHFPLQTTSKGNLGTLSPFLSYVDVFFPDHKHLGKLHKHLRKLSKTSCTCLLLRIFVLPPPPLPFTQVEGGNA